VKESTDDAADVTRVEEVLNFVKQQATTLERYAGDKLTKTIIKMTMSAKDMYEAIQKVKKMAHAVKYKALDIKKWMQSFDELPRDKVTELHKETWRSMLKDW